MSRKEFTIEGYTGPNPDFEITLPVFSHGGKVDFGDVIAALDGAFINGQAEAIRLGGCGDYLQAVGDGATTEERDDLAEKGEQVFLIYGLPEADPEDPADDNAEGELFMLRVCAA